MLWCLGTSVPILATSLKTTIQLGEEIRLPLGPMEGISLSVKSIVHIAPGKNPYWHIWGLKPGVTMLEGRGPHGRIVRCFEVQKPLSSKNFENWKTLEKWIGPQALFGRIDGTFEDYKKFYEIRRFSTENQWIFNGKLSSQAQQKLNKEVSDSLKTLGLNWPKGTVNQEGVFLQPSFSQPLKEKILEKILKQKNIDILFLPSPEEPHWARFYFKFQSQAFQWEQKQISKNFWQYLTSWGDKNSEKDLVWEPEFPLLTGNDIHLTFHLPKGHGLIKGILEKIHTKFLKFSYKFQFQNSGLASDGLESSLIVEPKKFFILGNFQYENKEKYNVVPFGSEWPILGPWLKALQNRENIFHMEVGLILENQE